MIASPCVLASLKAYDKQYLLCILRVEKNDGFLLGAIFFVVVPACEEYSVLVNFFGGILWSCEIWILGE